MTIDNTTWLYVAVLKTGPSEQIVGQTDSEHNLDYIPAFLNKEAAQQALLYLHLDRKKKYEVQAIIYEDLAQHAADNGFLIFVLDEEGTVLERLAGATGGN